ncbi:Tat pathway signal protein [Arthrobacter sp. CG_A4]|uniref:Tat pathway signal protein n=1 Tax=Arthrobacter sp. CG_A4 TaxID=3071706 RepID=UPI002E05ABB9|nr:hypothetical protein [Arthrobacter sp. CG_A4]
MDKQENPEEPKPDHERTDEAPPAWGTAREDFTSRPRSTEGQQPPWQVPRPALRPELLGQPDMSVPPGAPAPGGPAQPVPPVGPSSRESARRQASAPGRKKRLQRRTVVVALGVTALLAGTITAMVASNEEDADYAQVCFDDGTGERVDDSQCNNSSTEGRGSGVYAWYFYSRGANVPALGQNRASYPSYTRTVPAGAKASTGYSSKGGTVSRGGFGSSSKGGSTGG